MKVYLILGLLVMVAYAEKKINLEDIERDNLRAESKSKIGNLQTEETKYPIKSDANQQQYRILSQYNTFGGHSEAFIPSHQLQDVKYGQVPREQYIHPNQYSVHEAQYQQSNQILPEQNISPAQYYNGYQQQAEVKDVTTNAQKLNYQPEVVVGNHIQSVQQKAITEKYTKAVNKGPVYLNVPTTQVLSYYPHLDINGAMGVRDVGLTPPSLQLINNAGQISLPLYAPVYNQKQVAPSIKTIDQYPIVPVTFTNKVLKGSASNYKDRLPAALKKPNLSPQPPVSLHVQPQQSFVQGKKLLHTQAYITPAQPQYVQQLVYAQPGVIYSDPAAAYSDLYARIPIYIPDNSLRVQANQYQIQQQLYAAPTADHETPREVLQEQIVQDLPQNYVKVTDEPKTHFIPPQLPAQDFKSGVTQLELVPFENEESIPVRDHHSLPSEPKSLLDTYIPSKIIAAQDSARYRERPIKLEVFSSQK